MFRLVSFFKYLLKSKGEQAIHSPFVFELYQEVIRANTQFYCFASIEDLRQVLKEDHTKIKVEDYGAGSGNAGHSEKTVAQIAQKSIKSAAYAQLIFRLACHREVKNVLELGTSLGITTAYLAHAVNDGKVMSLEGSPDILLRALAQSKKLNVDHKCEFIQGPFQKTLSGALQKGPFDLVFIDGHHVGDAMLNYLEMIKPNLTKDAVVIVDDIHWSADMQEAWNKVILDADFSVSIDLFEMGLLFNGPETPKQHFVLRHLPSPF